MKIPLFQWNYFFFCLDAVDVFWLRCGNEINYFLFFFTRSFTTLCYSADGQSILAGGLSKFVCIYNVKEQILMKKFEISCNLSLDAMEVCDYRSQSPFPSHSQNLDFGVTSNLNAIHEHFVNHGFILFCAEVCKEKLFLRK